METMIIIIILRSGFMVFHLNFPVKISLSIRKASNISFFILSQKAAKTAASVPKWNTIVIVTAPSPSRPVKCWNSERCPELDTGRNSVSPCNIPCKIASIILIVMFLFCFVFCIIA